MSQSSIRINIDDLDPKMEVFGSLSEEIGGQNVPYMPCLLSKYGIGIIARAGLDVLHDMTLDCPIGFIKMRVLSVETNGVPVNASRYHLMAVGLNIDFEQIYTSDSKIKDLISRSILHFARFQTIPAVVIEAKTFGSSNLYRFKSVNASKRGIFVVSHDKKKAPFRISTLVEFNLLSNDSWLNSEVSGVARVAHQSTHEGSSGSNLQYYGLELKDFKGDTENIWKLALEALERQTIDHQLKEAEKDIAG